MSDRRRAAYSNLARAITSDDRGLCADYGCLRTSCETKLWLSGRRCCAGCAHDHESEAPS